MTRFSLEQFEQLVAEALDSLPAEFGRLLDNVAVVVEERPSVEDLEAVGMGEEEWAELFGMYHGINLLERDSFYDQPMMPDRIAIYRQPILLACSSRREVLREVRDTVIHELGHYFGMEENQMPY